MYISLLLDTEDLIAPEADDVAMWCADILHEERAPATFCVVGENARLLKSRKRSDVIASLTRHDIGLHSDQHSVHPTIMEYLRDKGWDDGIAEVVRRESPGLASIREVFGKSPSTFAGPGATWGPQIHAAMRQLGIPSVMYALTAIPGGRNIHRFAGTRSYPRRDFTDMNDGSYRNPVEWRTNFDINLKALKAFQDAGYHWAGVFMGHPTHILHENFWDFDNLAYGKTVPRAQWVPPKRISDADLKVALANFRTTARTLRNLPGIEIKAIAEMNAIYDRASTAPVDRSGQESVWERIHGDLAKISEWPILEKQFDFSKIAATTRGQLHTLETESLVAG
ncbi:MAG: polysaccharide deacetylase family protein [Planctomycetes bacterium]|nr:polysaccharide deacetylase family protein [Planctomycetota bacterium]